MDEIKKLRRAFHVEQAHRIHLELNIEVVRALLADEQNPSGSTPAQVAELLRLLMVSGREARQLEARYRAVMRSASLTLKHLKSDDVPSLLLGTVTANLPGFAGWLLERRPDLDRAIREAYAAQAPLRVENGEADDILPG